MSAVLRRLCSRALTALRCASARFRTAALVAPIVTCVTLATGCGGPGPGASTAAAPVPSVTLTTPEQAVFSLPAGTAQATLRLAGDVADVDQLVADIAAAGSADGGRRWPVDAAAAGSDGARASVTLPAYELRPGDYVVTVWRDDAEVVGRYTFRVLP